MRRAAFVLAAMVAFAATGAAAEPVYLSGTIGKAPILAAVERKGAELSGWYLYLRVGKQIQLNGKIDATGNFSMNETLYGSATVTGVLKGAVHGAQWGGTWSKPGGGASLPLALAENRDTLASLSGNFSCDPKVADAHAGWTFDQSLIFNIAHGKVTKLAVAHTAKGNDGDEQMCGIDLRDLERKASTAGALFRANGDDPAEEGPHCSVRVLAAGDYLYLQMGDSTEAGNDCTGNGTGERYCTPRGNFNDLVMNRKTGVCTMVQ